jgi:Lipocalin-like domain
VLDGSAEFTLGAKAEQKGRDNAGGRLREGRLGKWEGQGMEHGGRNKFRTALATPRRGMKVGKLHQGRNIMKRLSTLALTTMSLLLLGVVLLAGDAIAQQKSLKEQLVGTWIYVSRTETRADGNKTYVPNLKGILIYTSDGHFVFVNVRDDLPKLANPDRARATAEEAQAVVAGSLAYYGTYSINEVDKVITPKVEGSTFANMIGTDQKRIITSLTADELKFTNPSTPAGVKLEFVWKRAK